jgi:class 3 adenylate cyclase/type III secretory pathway lipoprotein EscJ
MALAGAGLPRTGRIGFELFDRANLGASDFTEQVNYRRALEGELERTVGTLAEVAQARIHLTFPKDSVFLDARQPAKATVVLQLRRASRIAQQNVQAIANLIASSVDGLMPEAVAIIDSSGRLLNRPSVGEDSGTRLAEADLEYRRQIESGLMSRINSVIGALRRSQITVLAVAIGMVVATALSLASGWWFDAASPLAALAALAAAAWTRRAQEQQQQRQELQGLLQQTTSTSVAGELWRQRELLLEGGRFPGRRLELTVLFTDIEHFTQVAEQLDPEALLAWLNRGMAAMVGPVQGEGGLVNKFTGDGLLAVFGAPLDRGTQLEGLAAVQAAAMIRRALASLNAQLRAEGLPQMRVRIGIHTGPVLAGSVGTPERWEFSVVGDTVNCAARIEGLQCNEGPSPACRVLLSGTTLALVRETIRGPWKLWGTLPLSGRSTAVEVWELLEKESA